MHKIFILVAFLAITSAAKSQVYFEEPIDSTTSFDDRVYFGGNFSLNFGTFTFIDISPLAGYMINENFSLGLGGGYTYIARDVFFLPGPRRVRLRNNAYGGRVFARHNVIDGFFAHVEYESINTEFLLPDADGTTRGWVPGFLIGGGRTFGAFNQAGVNVTMLLNLLHDEAKSPYPSVFIVRAGVTF